MNNEHNWFCDFCGQKLPGISLSLSRFPWTFSCDIGHRRKNVRGGLHVEATQTKTDGWWTLLPTPRNLWYWKQELKSRQSELEIVPCAQWLSAFQPMLLLLQLDDDIDDSGSECVICMCETRDTIILSCRHLCLCNGCADNLRYQANNCPICRAPFRALLQIRAMRKKPANSPAPALNQVSTHWVLSLDRHAYLIWNFKPSKSS